MSTIIPFVLYIALFIGICIFFVNGIAFFNIWFKSYNPRNSIVIISILGILLGINGLFALVNGLSLIQSIRAGNADFQIGRSITNTTF